MTQKTSGHELIGNILVVDDEKDICSLLSDILSDNGFSVTTAHDSQSAFRAIEKSYPSLIILDIWLKNSKLDGIGILEQVQAKCPFIPVIVISGHATKQIAEKAINIGAFEYLEKPFQEERILSEVRKALKFNETSIQAEYLNRRYKQRFSWFEQNYEKVNEFKKKYEKYFFSDQNLILQGSQTHELRELAYYIHNQNNSTNKKPTGRFTTLNTNIIDKDKHSLYLFGKQGVGDFNSIFGALDFSSRGTIFIDDVFSLEKQTQKLLLNFFSSGKFNRLNGEDKVVSNARFITAFDRKVEDGINSGVISQDFIDRLKAKEIKVPNPLSLVPSFKELLADINFAISKNLVLKQLSFTDQAVNILSEHNWNGAIREIVNFVENIYFLAPKNSVVNADVISDILEKNNHNHKKDSYAIGEFLNFDIKEAREQFESLYIKEMLKNNNHNISKTAKIIGMERSALHRKMKMLAMD